MRTLNCALWDLVPQPRMEPEPPALEGQDLSPLDHQKSPHDIFLDAAMGQSQEADIFPFVGCWLLQEGGHVAPFSAGEALHSHSFLPPCVVIAPATEATTLKDKSQCTEDGEGDGETTRLLEGIIKLLDPPGARGRHSLAARSRARSRSWIRGAVLHQVSFPRCLRSWPSSAGVGVGRCLPAATQQPIHPCSMLEGPPALIACPCQFSMLGQQT